MSGTMREALEAIIVRCREGDKNFDWRSTIADIAERAITAQSLDSSVGTIEVTEAMVEAGMQALADDVWHPPQKLSSLPQHDQNRFRRQSLLVVNADTTT